MYALAQHLYEPQYELNLVCTTCGKACMENPEMVKSRRIFLTCVHVRKIERVRRQDRIFCLLNRRTLPCEIAGAKSVRKGGAAGETRASARGKARTGMPAGSRNCSCTRHSRRRRRRRGKNCTHLQSWQARPRPLMSAWLQDAALSLATPLPSLRNAPNWSTSPLQSWKLW